jgi:hypothetical protein
MLFIGDAIHYRLESTGYVSLSIQLSQRSLSKLYLELGSSRITLETVPFSQLLTLLVLLLVNHFSELSGIFLELEEPALVIDFRCLLATWDLLGQVR